MIKYENGFLDNGIQDKIIKVKTKYGYIFDLMNNFNMLSYKIMDNYAGIEANDKNLYILPAFVEINKLYQSSIIMLEYGLKSSFESLLRNIIELWIQMIYVFNNSNNVYRLEKSTYAETKKKLDFICENKLYEIIPEESANKIKTKLEKEIQGMEMRGIKKAPNVKDMCDSLKLKKEYAYYCFESDYTHSDYSNVVGLNITTEKGVYINANGSYDLFENDSLRLLSVLEEIVLKMIEEYVPSLKGEYDLLIKTAIGTFKKNAK